jgi:bis(5'-nucleosyl)-tetraphosphatase (symmetrical)
MATWAIGDVHGCYRSLRKLLATPEIAATDRLWFVGDLVNRGPRSLDTLRFVADLGDRASTVLGNHDLHFLAVAAGAAGPRKRDTLRELLDAPDRDRLVSYLASRPLLVAEDGWTLIHAGVLGSWSMAEVERRARGAEAVLARPETAYPYLAAYRPRAAVEPGPVEAPILETIRVLTLLRTVTSGGEPIFGYTGTLAGRPAGSSAWFDAAGRRSAGARIVFGHWAALGLLVRPDALALDTGCAWGGTLTAVRLEDGLARCSENVD